MNVRKAYQAAYRLERDRRYLIRELKAAAPHSHRQRTVVRSLMNVDANLLAFNQATIVCARHSLNARHGETPRNCLGIAQVDSANSPRFVPRHAGDICVRWFDSHQRFVRAEPWMHLMKVVG
jgi:hypothetical protein